MPLRFPIRVRRLHDHNGEIVQVAIVDALERSICFYTERLDLRREIAKLWTPEEAEALAKHIARMLSDEWAVQVVIHKNCAGTKEPKA